MKQSSRELVTQREHLVEVDGAHLRALSPVALPTHRCVKCGSAQPGGSVMRSDLSYVNPLVWLTIFLSGLITIVAYFATRKKVQVRYYLCPICESSQRVGRITTNLVAAVSVVGLVVTASGGPFEVFLSALVLSWVARMFWVRPPLHAVAHDNGRFALKGAAPEFLLALEHKRLELAVEPKRLER